LLLPGPPLVPELRELRPIAERLRRRPDRKAEVEKQVAEGEKLIENLECQRCYYSLCPSCYAGAFDEENMEFNILLSALVLSEPELCADILREFPSATDYVPRVASWLQKYSRGELPYARYGDAWFLYDQHDAAQLLERIARIN
jgi:hypothetical protein